VNRRATRDDIVTIVVAPDAVTVQRGEAGRREFIALATALMAMGALGIDLMLPTFPDMRAEFGMAADSAQVGWIVTSFFLGMAIGPWLYGPISDRYGRRRPLFMGMSLYVVSAAAASIAPSFWWIVVARFVWGLGAAAPRTLSLAIIRDRYEGDGMARLMSMIMAVFLLVPIVAPSLGAGLNLIAPWRVVFWLPAVVATGITLWAARRLPETLVPERRRPFTRAALFEGAKAVFSNRQTMCFTLAIMFLFGVMASFLSGSELILEDVYGYGDYFPFFFGAIALLLAVSSLNNARLVGRVGVTVLVRRMAVIGVSLAAVLTVVSFTNGGRPNFWLFAVALGIMLPLAQGLVPNANTAAMAPVPHVAGTASAIIATITTAGGALLGGFVSGAFDGTVRPFAVGVFAFIAISAALILFGATTRAGAVKPQIAID
jgi:MFS transporter, DHA1 family, multidrug resistance protein